MRNCPQGLPLYVLRKIVEDPNNSYGGGIIANMPEDIPPSQVYMVLKRLKDQGIIKIDRVVKADVKGRARIYYSITREGRKTYERGVARERMLSG